MMDAYTTTSYFPYSQPISGLGNYMRAAFKVVVNAYTGSVDIYLYDEADPIGRAYKNVFPNLIKPKSEFPRSSQRISAIRSSCSWHRPRFSKLTT